MVLIIPLGAFPFTKKPHDVGQTPIHETRLSLAARVRPVCAGLYEAALGNEDESSAESWPVTARHAGGMKGQVAFNTPLRNSKQTTSVGF